MIKKVLTVLFCFSIMSIVAQELDKDLLRIQRKLDTISAFKADMELEVAISFINMPKKTAVIEFEKGKPITFSSKDLKESEKMLPRSKSLWLLQTILLK